jgi:hypothetical protein
VDPRTLEAAFQEFTRRAGIHLDTSVPAAGIPLMLRFYQDRRADGYDWGSGDHFELDLTRQLILSTPAYSTVAHRAPKSILVQYECAG